MNKLAVIDWGIGGLGFYREWKSHRPGDGVVYFADSGFTPYGKLCERDLADRLHQIFCHLNADYGVTHIMVACNAASTVLERCPVSEDFVVQGVIVDSVAYVREFLEGQEVSVLGGTRTIESGIFQQLLPEYELHQKIAQPLSAIVESGDCYGCEAEYAVREIFKDVFDDVVLVCTHYVALTKLIAELYPNIRCHDPIPYLVKKKLAEWENFESGEDIFITTGDPDTTEKSAKKSFGVNSSFNSIELSI